MDPAKFDYSALTAHYSTQQMVAFVKQRFTTQKYIKLIMAAVIFPVLFLIFFAVPLYFMAIIFWAFTPESVPVLLRTVIVLAGLGAVLATLGLLVWKAVTYLVLQSMRITTFAINNGLTLLDGPPVGEQGVIFNHGHSQQFSWGLRTPDSEGLTIGNYQYTVGSGKNSHTYTYGLIRCNLSRTLPNVLIDATKNNMMKRFSNLGTFSGSERMELEGDFNQYFNVFCQQGYGRDTLYWLTPELMQLLKDHMADYDLEIIGNHVYAYSDTQIQATQQSIQSMFQLANWLQAEFEENTHRYSDQRVTAGQATSQGSVAPLKQKSGPIKIAWILFAIAYAAIHLLSIFNR